MKRIAVIGPVPPYRGGIAHHTGRLAEALGNVADVRVFSFSRLYPRWLYPGKFQTEAELPETKGDAEFLLDALNPVSWRKTAGQIERFRPDAVVIPWWTFFLAPCFRYLAKRLSRQGIGVIFVCHNVVDHEAAGWKRYLSGSVLRHGRSFLVQTREEEGKLRDLLGDVSVTYHPHPVYDHFPSPHGRFPRRAGLELLFYGFIRPYKGLDILIDAMAHLRGMDVFLSIVGEPWGNDSGDWLRRIGSTGMADRIEFVPRYVTDAETAEYFNRADVLMLPYRSATGTGVVAIAYRYRKPVIASNVGGLKDVIEDGVSGLLLPRVDAAAVAEAVRTFSLERERFTAAGVSRVAAEMSWEHMADTLNMLAGAD